MRSLITLTLLAGSLGFVQAKEGGPLQYDPMLGAQQRSIVRFYVRTRVCLGDAGRAILRQGVREPAIVKHFMTSMCADGFYGQLRRDGMPEEEARRTLVELTETVLREDILSPQGIN